MFKLCQKHKTCKNYQQHGGECRSGGLECDAHESNMKDKDAAWKNLYSTVNEMMMRLGADGEVNAQQTEAENVMSALAEIDGGVYDSDLASLDEDPVLPICAGCGRLISHDWPRTGTMENPVCMPCEFSNIEVYKVELNGNHFVESDPKQIIPLLESMDKDDEPYTIGKVEMKLAEYITLPEFQGF